MTPASGSWIRRRPDNLDASEQLLKRLMFGRASYDLLRKMALLN